MFLLPFFMVHTLAERLYDLKTSKWFVRFFVIIVKLATLLTMRYSCFLLFYNHNLLFYCEKILNLQFLNKNL